MLGGLSPVWQGRATQVGLHGAVSRTCTAPVDRLKFLMIMAHPDKQTRLTVRQVPPQLAVFRARCCSQFPLIQGTWVAIAV